MRYYKIGELSKIVNLSIETIRYYEKIRLIPKPERFNNRYKKYSEMYIYRLKIIIKAKNYGFTLHEISNFLSEVSTSSIEDIDLSSTIMNKVQQIEKECERLNYKKNQLLKFEEEINDLQCPVLNRIINEKNT
ncbi:DNA-binding transcriptional MerR regulator [Clostridium acetobutylicum]|uniref:Mercuric resistance operon regulatory protein, MerR family n=1 Tax=Clostridium acetobutylicum (strain ATCC 824 / DSM 792 / JCM 1419 / IAM 19013 / LMG 5710 / NBRC 13948 / NRRL B-527 / VKM B-1787 / 2291 / W) TaxID=272562 RepID=Q97LU3_CLOAB|nr:MULTISPECIES: heavy metal-responsive transcriptional regulator [Clostridium]AAK78441.1 Mercuric resistance operon regulatory protein, MerR family [Clostridium acetobutylicum ATCC 824]ADZ19511.1 Mercuric resistance operon regulatory protein, MerR family [Clostridium acetobutylicum EA 2018]AEI33050.1 mercuric resistance operon regulatory protein [Clostridium acetobutylicum DSM 1731]AWV80163.1 heavy metal-responsive transcriptional regulator [Clostridium acetobutylicum]MBC2392344.1 heavy metal